MILKERLDFTFSLEDFIAVDKLFNNYIDDRIHMYNELFIDNSNYTSLETSEYINFFITPIIKDTYQHPYLDRIIHFLERDYEFFTLPKVYNVKEELLHLLSIYEEDIENLECFIEYEYNTVNRLVDLWLELYGYVQELPILTLNILQKDIIFGTTVYYEEDTDPFIRKNFVIFLEKIHELFPEELSHFDAFIIVDPKYIEFSAGENTQAFFMKNFIFLKSQVKEEDKVFYCLTLFHEWGHRIFESLPEKVQIDYYNVYDKWIYNNIKMTREPKEKNSVEELFADCISLLIFPSDDFLKQPDPIIINYIKIILENYFSIIFN